ncbi:MAG: SAM-dependent methyltransferase [Cyanobacteriota bacterium]
MNQILNSSFRDPSGFLFFKNNVLYRQVNKIYKEDYDYLLSSGLYKSLVDSKLLVSHDEVDISIAKKENAYKVIKPELVPFISYPYEWCFSQLKDAALLTLQIQKKALDYGMSLKDASAYNIQFVNGKPIFIDTLSFERYKENTPWVAYRQFCQFFYAPLMLMTYKDIRLSQIMKIYIDGIPVDLASSILPKRTLLNFSCLSNIHLHSKTQKHYENKTIKTSSCKMSKFKLLALVDNLETSIKKLKYTPVGTEWAEYYEITNYSDKALIHKKEIVTKFIEDIKPDKVWDLGANRGEFSRISANKGIFTISADIDPASVEKNYLECLKKKERNILPLVLDLTNPSPALGWHNKERLTFFERGPVNTVLALALIHHLAISNNLPLNTIAEFFSQICTNLIIEFVPKVDSQVQKILSTRKDIFPDYTLACFENEFSNYFDIIEAKKVDESERVLYHLLKKE